jgi:hypothetical protein
MIDHPSQGGQVRFRSKLGSALARLAETTVIGNNSSPRQTFCRMLPFIQIALWSNGQVQIAAQKASIIVELEQCFIAKDDCEH